MKAMNRSHAGAARGHTRRRHRFVSFTGLLALFGALFVTGAAPAHALIPCAVPDNPLLCPLTHDDNYTVPFGQKLTVPAATGLLANDEGPPGTRIQFADQCTDTSSFWTDATFNVKSDGSFTYTPAGPSEPYSGDDSLTYCIIDPATGNEDDTGTVNITVLAVARDDSYGTRVNTPLTVSAPGLVANDLGIDSSSIILDTTTAHGGTIDDNFDGAFVYTPPTDYQGPDTFSYTGWDIDADHQYWATVTIYVDGTPPVVTMTPLAPVTLNTKVPISWSGTDNTGGPITYDVQQRIAPWNAGFPLWTALRTATIAKSASVTASNGRTLCFRTRAKDLAGNYSLFTPQQCTAVPIRARSLKYSAGWIRTTSPLYFSGEAYSTSTKGRTAGLAAVQAQHMWLVATTCATCGTVQVRWNNVVIANVNLASAATVHHKLIPIAAFATPRAGTVGFYVTSPTGKVVKIEGLAVLHA
jgi:hypothetical protein